MAPNVKIKRTDYHILYYVACLGLLLIGCSTQTPAPAEPAPAKPALAEPAPAAIATNSTLSHSATTAPRPVVLFDSFHAHNFLDRGLIPGEHTYHRFTGLRRAAGLLADRQVDVQELLVGPITSAKLDGVRLVVLNLPSMDRPPWLTSEIDAIEGFIRGGGGMIFITDHTNCYYHQYHILPLWQRLGLIPTFETSCERTTKNLLSQSGPGWLMVRDFDRHPITEGVRYFGTQTGGRVVGEGIIARTSPDAWADAGLSPLYGEGNPGLTGDLQFSASEEQGAQGIVLAKSIDGGRVVVISDQNSIGDAQISYADNWRLWLNACNWAGQLKIDANPLTIDKISANRAAKVNVTSATASTPFDQLVSGQPDRNANPSLPLGSWQIECWEDLSGGSFHWGSTDADHYYYFWCWLNRWCWASAHEGPSNPAPSGRTLLLASENNLKSAALKRRLEQVIAQNGKVVLLGDSATETPAFERNKWTRDLLNNCLSDVDVGQLIETATWHEQPLLHAQMAKGGGVLVLVPDVGLLQNSHFTPPAMAPNAMQSKWQRQLYHWLFEQP